MIHLMLGDCLERMGEIEDGSIDLVLCDLPYGVTSCRWDSVIPFEPLWSHYKRLLKPRGVVVLTASQPFTSMLVMSNPKWFKYELVWHKTQSGSPGVARVRPMPCHESVLIFAPSRTTYNPQMGQGKPYKVTTRCANGGHGFGFTGKTFTTINEGDRYPLSVFTIRKAQYVSHPTQKPVALMEYLIRTYSNEGETVLDNCMGSGTTGVACLNTGRNFIGIEKDPAYFKVGQKRINEAQSAAPLFAASQ